jgi:hypothetical protein
MILRTWDIDPGDGLEVLWVMGRLIMHAPTVFIFPFWDYAIVSLLIYHIQTLYVKWGFMNVIGFCLLL